MGHLFDRSGPNGSWLPVGIPEGGLSIVRNHDGGLVLRPGRERGALGVVLGLETVGLAALVTDGSQALLVNGQRALDVAVLEERDEIVIAATGEHLYYGARRATGVVAFAEVPGRAGQSRCARCARILEDADRVIACPACGGAHHERDASGGELACWSHDPACGACGRPRDGLLWSPATEEEDAVETEESSGG